MVEAGTRQRDPLADAEALVAACAWPSEAYWRLLELAVVRRWSNVRHPFLELGCGNGAFAELAGLSVDLGVDREPRAVERASRRTAVYAAVRCIDIHELSDDVGRFAMIFSNSVLEHVPDVVSVLARCRQLLMPGGQLVATVPLRDMNRNLALSWTPYVRVRQRQLHHRNLWSLGEWEREMAAAGFASVTAERYLDGAACRRWDRLDALGALGTRRYRVAPIANRAAHLVLPAPAKDRVNSRIARMLIGWTRRPPEGPCCAALLVARATE